jgi:hypothetical protein
MRWHIGTSVWFENGNYSVLRNTQEWSPGCGMPETLLGISGLARPLCFAVEDVGPLGQCVTD